MFQFLKSGKHIGAESVKVLLSHIEICRHMAALAFTNFDCHETTFPPTFFRFLLTFQIFFVGFARANNREGLVLVGTHISAYKSTGVALMHVPFAKSVSQCCVMVCFSEKGMEARIASVRRAEKRFLTSQKAVNWRR